MVFKEKAIFSTGLGLADVDSTIAVKLRLIALT